MFPVNFPRMFQVWRYSVSHSQLLLRSPPTDELVTRVDVGFVAVDYIQLPTLMPTLRIAEGTLTDLPPGVVSAVDAPHMRVFLIEAAGTSGCVVAGNAFWGEDVGTYADESTVLPCW